MRQSSWDSSCFQLTLLKLTSTVELGCIVVSLGTSVDRQTGVTPPPHQLDVNRKWRESAYLQVVDLVVILVLGVQEPEREVTFQRSDGL